MSNGVMASFFMRKDCDWIDTDPPKPREEPPPPDQGRLLCNRSQLPNLFSNNQVEPGVYFYDEANVIRVTWVAPGVVPWLLTSLSVVHFPPGSDGFFYHGTLRGGNKKKPMSKKQAAAIIGRAVQQKIKGKGAYGAPAAIQGNGAFSINRTINSIGKTLRNVQKQASKSAHFSGSGSYKPHTMKWKGNGSYSGMEHFSTDVNNQLVNNDMPSSRITDNHDESDGRSVTGVEYFGDVFNNTAATLSGVTFPMNPGINLPKLQQFASNYISYKVTQLVFCFKSDVVSISGSLGEVLAYFDYSPDATPASSRIQILDYHGGAATRVDQSMCLGVECDPKKTYKMTNLLIRTVGLTGNQGPANYDFGKFNVYTFNIPTAVVPSGGIVGRLYAYYTVKLAEPILGVYRGITIRQDQFLWNSGLTAANPWPVPVAANIGSYNNMGGTTSGLTYTFGDYVTGAFELCGEIVGTSFSNAPSTPTVAGNVRLIPVAGATGTGLFDSVASATKCHYYMTVVVDSATSAGGNRINWVNGPFTATTVTNSTLRVTQINPFNSFDNSAGGNL